MSERGHEAVEQVGCRTLNCGFIIMVMVIHVCSHICYILIKISMPVVLDDHLNQEFSINFLQIVLLKMRKGQMLRTGLPRGGGTQIMKSMYL